MKRVGGYRREGRDGDCCETRLGRRGRESGESREGEERALGS